MRLRARSFRSLAMKPFCLTKCKSPALSPYRWQPPATAATTDASIPLPSNRVTPRVITRQPELVSPSLKAASESGIGPDRVCGWSLTPISGRILTLPPASGFKLAGAWSPGFSRLQPAALTILRDLAEFVSDPQTRRPDRLKPG